MLRMKDRSEVPLTEIDQRFACGGPSPVSLHYWMEIVERPLRRSLRGFASVVDVESVLQETMMQMWLLVRDEERPSIRGENASLWFAVDKARSIAQDEARR